MSRSGTAGDEGQQRVQDGVGWAELIVDAVVGTGFKPPLRGWALVVKDCLDAVKTPVVAVDLPSGWDADAMESTRRVRFGRMRW